MAKRFAGFTPEQMGKIIPEMQGMQADEQAKFLASQPGAAARVGKMAELAQKRIGMAAGGMTKKKGYAEGGMADTTTKVFDPISGKNLTPFQINNRINSPNLGQPYADAGITSAKDFLNANTPNTTGSIDIGFPDPYGQPTTPKTTGGFDMAGTMGGTGGDLGTADDLNKKIDIPEYGGTDPQPEIPAYDPSQGLPEAVATAEENITAAFDNSPEDFYVNKVDFEPNKKFAIDQSKELADNAAIMENPDDHLLVKRNGRWYIDYPDGTSINTGYAGASNAQARAKGLAEALKLTKANKEKQDIYTQQLDQYKTYYGQQAQTAAETPVFETIDAAQGAVTTSQNLVSNYMKQLAALPEDDPQRATLEGLIADEQKNLNQAKAGLTQAQQRAAEERSQKRMQATTEFEADPTGQVTRADVATVSQAQKEAGSIAAGTGQAGTAATAATVAAAKAGDVAEPERKAAVTYTAEETANRIQNTLDKLVATTGKPQADALTEAQTMDAGQLAQLGLTAAQIEEATQVVAPDKLTVQEGELVSGTAVDFERAKAETNFTAATGVPSTEATVQGQLTGLLEQFEGGATPAWAAGAMRAATATLAARGLGASSMAGQAIVQAAMESAMPIAMADAQTRASFEAQNLSNRQQAAMFAAEQRSKFLGMEFDQEFQTRVQNAARIADVANQNFTADVQIALENSRLANTVDIANLNAKNAKLLSDAAAMTQTDLTNLNNRQQAAVQNANAFLQFDLKEFDAKQQVAMFKTQGVIQSILTDSAAVNAAAQFNATSENQTNQFYDSLISQVQQFNVDQTNAMERFNSEQANAIAQFNAAQSNRRSEFNAQQSLVVEQANAKWAQDIALTETAAINEVNRDEARAANEMSAAAYEAQIQMERDNMSYAFQTANNNADRATQIAIQTMVTEASASEASAKKSSAFAAAIGTVTAEIIKG